MEGAVAVTDRPVCPRCGAERLAAASSFPVCPCCVLSLALAGDGGERRDNPGEQHGQSADPPSFGSIAGYAVIRILGEGGMGIVYLAQQDHPLRRTVALKVIKVGMDTKQVVARFEEERQTLALMNHAFIAKVFEAGETSRGLPYFAMEYVEGEPITLYCDRRKLSIRERLEIFNLVCEGVQHAHQKGIIHRDLKPSNVLVT